MVGGDFDCCAGAGNQAEHEALVQTIASSLAMSYGSHVNAPKGGRDWKAAENLLGVLNHLGFRRIDPDDEALVEKVANAVGCVRWHRHGLKPLPTDEEIARAALEAITTDPRP